MQYALTNLENYRKKLMTKDKEIVCIGMPEKMGSVMVKPISMQHNLHIQKANIVDPIKSFVLKREILLLKIQNIGCFRKTSMFAA